MLKTFSNNNGNVNNKKTCHKVLFTFICMHSRKTRRMISCNNNLKNVIY